MRWKIRNQRCKILAFEWRAMSTRAVTKILVVLILMFFLVSCGDNSNGVISIGVIPLNASATIGQTVQFEAWATRARTPLEQTDVTGVAKWESTNTSVATIDATGLALASLAGLRRSKQSMRA